MELDTGLDSGELFDIERVFFSGAYQEVLTRSTNLSTPEGKVAAEAYIARAEIELGKITDVITKLSGRPEPVLKAVKYYAEYRSGKKAEAKKDLQDLASSSNEDTVLYFAALVLSIDEEYAQALTVALSHQGSLECVALATQIYLVQNRLDLATKLLEDAKRWANDSIIFNLADSWVKLRANGSNAQDAFYTYEDISPASVKSLIGQAVSRLELGHIPEAQDLLAEATQLGHDPNVLANSIAAAILVGSDYTDYENQLEHMKKDHASLISLKEKSDLFDKVAAEFQKA